MCVRVCVYTLDSVNRLATRGLRKNHYRRMGSRETSKGEAQEPSLYIRVRVSRYHYMHRLHSTSCPSFKSSSHAASYYLSLGTVSLDTLASGGDQGKRLGWMMTRSAAAKVWEACRSELGRQSIAGYTLSSRHHRDAIFSDLRYKFPIPIRTCFPFRTQPT